MNFDFLKDNLLIIIPNSYKKEILKYLNDNKMILNIKFMTIDEYKKKVIFDYNEKTIHYLKNKGMKVSNAITLINNLYYIENKDYHNDKLNYLVKIKKELDENHLLIYDKLFHKILNRYKVIIIGYGKLDKWELSLFNNYELIDYPNNNKKYQIYHVNNISFEVEMIFQKIIDLLKKGININKISLMNIDNEYIPIIKRYSLFYHIPVDIKSDNNLMGTTIGKEFYQLVCDDKNKDEIISNLSNFEKCNDYNTIINIINKYIEFDLYDVKEEIKYDLLNTKVSTDNYDNIIKVKNVFDYVGDDEYVFLMNFNNSSIPKMIFDTQYITDNIKELVNLSLTIDNNILLKENTLNYLSNINNLIISYKDESSFNKFFPSILLDNMDYELLEYERSFNYSDMANRVIYNMYLDDYVKYGVKDKNIDILYNTYGNNNYLSYTNEFTNLSKDKLIKYLNNELTLSYSSIDNYYKCAFKYYLSNILKIDLYEETFMTIIGNLFHEVLRHMNDDDFNFSNQYNLFLKDKTFTYKEQFFLNKLKDELENIIEVIRKQEMIIGFNNKLYEEKIDINLCNDPYIHFKGFIDKIMYKEKDNDTLVSIIDYKTGNPDIKIKNLSFGLSMQLPIYLYLVHNSNLFKNTKFTGFYLQHILSSNLNKSDISKEDERLVNMKLKGYSTEDKQRLEIFDPTYENSEIIGGMKVNKDGTFNHYANTLSDSEIDDIINVTKEKINEAIKLILEGRFTINPKILDNENISCRYCKYQDICYRSDKDNVYLKRKEDTSGLD